MFLAHWYNKDQKSMSKFFGTGCPIKKEEKKPILAMPFGAGMLKTVKIHKCFFDESNYKMMNSLYMHCINIKHLELTSVLNNPDYQTIKSSVDSLVVMA